MSVPFSHTKYLTFLISFLGALVLSAFFVVPAVSFAQETAAPSGTVSGQGNYFEITDSEYLNISLGSSEEIDLHMQSIPEMITIIVEPVSVSTSTQLTFSGLAPLTKYYKYEDDYHNLAEIVTDANGSFIYAQDLTSPHLIFIQPRKSTKFIADNATGGDCTSIGIWDGATKTCTFTADVNETIQIDSNGITLDGAGHTLTGTGTGFGLFFTNREGVSVKNITVSNFSDGIRIYFSQQVTFSGNTILNNTSAGINLYQSSNIIVASSTISMNGGEGITLHDSSANIISGNTFSNNAAEGIALYNSFSNTLNINTIFSNEYGISFYSSFNNSISDTSIEGHNEAITFYSSHNNQITNTFIRQNEEGITLYSSAGNIIITNTIQQNTDGFTAYSSMDNIVYHNNFINNLNQSTVYGENSMLLSQELPIGGNYWSDFDELAEGCDDADNDTICDASYVFQSGQDDYPWVKQDGWSSANQAPALFYADEEGFLSDSVSPGVHPNKGTASDTEIVLKVVYIGAAAPDTMNVEIGGQGTTTFAMILDTSTASSTLKDGDYTNGEQFIAISTFPKGKYQYYFEATSGADTIRLPEADPLSFDIVNTPVVIVPGILGSYLDRVSDSEEVWVNANKMLLPFDIYLNELSLGGNGLPDLANPKLKTDGIIRNIDDQDFFSGLIAELESAGYQEGIDLFIFPYDWRLRNESNSTVLRLKVEDILQQTGAERVDIVAHSMGGLVVKYYIKHFGNSPVRKFIDIATPHLGAPKSFKTLMYGDDLNIAPLGIYILNDERLKIVSQNMPSIYQLLPSQQYFDPIDPNYSYYFYDADDLDNNGITGRLTYPQTTDFLGSMGRNTALLGEVDAFHQDLDNWNGADYGVNTTNIVGCGVPTIGKIFALNKEVGGYEYALGYVNGDATVPLRSAESVGADAVYYTNNIEHSTMPSAESIRQIVASVLTDKEINVNQLTDVSTDKTNCSFSGKALSFHSPIELHVYDDQGNHAGPTENGDIENTILGVQYDIVEGNKFAFLPDGQTYIIKTKATGTGTFNARIKTIENEEVTQTQYFNQIPLTTMGTNAQIKIIPNQMEFTIQIDQDGDSVFEDEIQPSATLDGNQSQDITKPETNISVEGTVGDNNWHLSNVQITLNAQDDNSGILKTEYSLDNGNTWDIYTVPILISENGETTILYKSTDNAGNTEIQKEYLLKIDKTAPEAKIYFDKDNLGLKVEGIDNITEDPTVSVIEQIEQQDSEGGDQRYDNHYHERNEEKQKVVYQIEDEAGNITELTFSELKEKGKEVEAKLENIKYNNSPAEFPKNEVKYKWELNKDSGMIEEMEQEIKVEKLFELKAKFKDGFTKIEVKEKHNKRQKLKLDSLVIMELTTNKGSLEYGY